MEIAVIVLLALAAAAAIVLWRKAETRGQKQMAEKAEAREAMTKATVKAEENEKLLQQVEPKYQQLLQQHNDDTARIAQLEETLNQERKQNAEKLSLLDEAKSKMSEQFKNLAQEILDDKSKAFEGNSQKLLEPLRQDIEKFRQRADEIHSEETKERASLKEQVTALQENASKIGEDANNLTLALKGDKKAQGDWGEITLEKLLEDSGLRKDEEYKSQESVRDENGNIMRPDVIIFLPDGNHLVVDSKVSLNAYSDYVTGIYDNASEHVKAVRTHIRTLADKHYATARGLNSPDFVFMFMPIEPAYFAALSADKKLFSDAYNKKIILVAPTTLMATLRTVERIWRLERQNKNAADIADRAGKIHDKLCGFVDDMEKIDRGLKNAQCSYNEAMKKLYDGSGNLIGQVEKLKELGANTKKELPTEKPRLDS